MLVRAQNEEKERRKRAAWIAKEVRCVAFHRPLTALSSQRTHPHVPPLPLGHTVVAQVMGFWGKAQRVVLYKVRTEVEARKKEVMDKQVGAASWTGAARVVVLLAAWVECTQRQQQRVCNP